MNHIHLLFFLEFSLSLIHVAFILILNIYLRNQGYSDPDIASFNSLRFVGALAFALPLGIYIRGKNLKPFFQLAALTVPLTSVLVIESIRLSITPLIQLSFLAWGLGMTLIRVCSLPFIIRNTDSDNSTEALSLIASTWSLSTIFSGLIISGLDQSYDEKLIKDSFTDNLELIFTSDKKINEVIPFLKKCKFCIGNDTGFSHLSVNLDIETLVIQGDCPPQSYSKLLKHVDIESNVNRSPTSIHTIKIEKVLDELSKLLNRRGGRVVEGARLESV